MMKCIKKHMLNKMKNMKNITSQRPSLRCLQNMQSGRCSALSNLDNVSTLASILVFYWCHRPNKKCWEFLVRWEPIWENHTCVEWFQRCYKRKLIQLWHWVNVRMNKRIVLCSDNIINLVYKFNYSCSVEVYYIKCLLCFMLSMYTWRNTIECCNITIFHAKKN